MINLTVLKTELREHRGWVFAWGLSLLTYAILIVLLYPGDEGMRNIMELMSDPMYAAFIGSIEGQNASYKLWQSMMSPFLGVVIAIFAILSGVKLTLRSISEKTGEIVNTLPISRNSFLFNRMLAMYINGILVIIAWFLPALIPINGYYLEIELVSKLIILTALYLVLMLSIGVLFGNIIGFSNRATQNGFILILFLYVFQIIVNLKQDNLSKTEFWDYSKEVKLPDGSKIETTVPYTLHDLLNDMNPITWYPSNSIILENHVEMKFLWLIIISSIVIIILSFYSYNKKDLIDGRALITVNWKKQKKDKQLKTDDYVRKHRSVKKSIYTIWVRPFEQRLPFTADFVYSDRRALFILTLAVILFWPLQLMAYTGDVTTIIAINSFNNGGIFELISYGHDLTVTAPWVWWVSTQALGLHWFLLIIMTFRWIRSVSSRDGEDGTGDLIGSLPIRKKQVVFQRLFAVFLELIWISFWMVVWYILSVALIESRVGTVITTADPANNVEQVIFEFNNTISTLWLAIAVFSLIPLYMFMVSFGTFVNLYFKEKGLRISKAMILVFVLLFIIAYSPGNPDLYWIAGIFYLYDPISMILDESIAHANYGILILIILNFVVLYFVYLNTKHFSWLKQDKKEFYQ